METFSEKKLNDLKFITSGLFISLIPLHDKKHSFNFMKLSERVLY